MAKKEIKRTKIKFIIEASPKPTVEDIVKPGFEFKPVDMASFYEEDKKRVEEDKVRYETEKKEEETRFNNLACPVCKNTDKKINRIAPINEPIVYGGRNSVNILAEYCICQGCGSMYVDLNKKEITYPYQGFFPKHNLHHY
jgi:hypothetical protein